MATEDHPLATEPADDPAPADSDVLAAAETEILAGADAGHRAIRGGALRTGAYLAGMGLSTVAAIFLLHHLSPTDWGRYATVSAMTAIATGLAEGGLSVTGQQQWIKASGDDARGRLLQNLIGMRIVISSSVVLVTVGFALLAGYPSVVVRGDVLAGLGAVFAVTAITVGLPLSVSLKLGSVTAIDFTTQFVTAAGMVVLVVVGASLLPFFVVTIAAGLAATLVAIALNRGRFPITPRLDRAIVRSMLKATGAVAFAVVVNQLYLRVLVILMSLLASGRELGLFATAYRINDIFVGLPIYIVASAFPILSHAGSTDDHARLDTALARLAEVSFVVALFVAVGTTVAAHPVVEILGGAKYAAAAPVLRIQCWALVGTSLTQVWTLGLVSVGRPRLLVITNGFALCFAVALGLVLIPLLHAEGGSIAAVAGELGLAGANLAMLKRARPEIHPPLRAPARAVACALIAGCSALLPLPALADGVIASLLFIVLAFVSGAIPRAVIDALRRRGGAAPAA
jgi:O-antigen/teichoic acid export membrane protein